MGIRTIDLLDDLDERELGLVVDSVMSPHALHGRSWAMARASTLGAIIRSEVGDTTLASTCPVERVLLRLVGGDGWLLCHVPERMRTRELCLAAVRWRGWTLQYVPHGTRDREMCLEAMMTASRDMAPAPYDEWVLRYGLGSLRGELGI